MKKDILLKPINTIELEFKDKDEFLEWRRKIFDNYEQSKLTYEQEMRTLFGYSEETDTSIE